MLVGSGSMLGAAMMAQTKPGLDLTGIGHTQFAGLNPGEYDIVINMAYDPRYMRAAYDQALDYDLRVAHAAAAAGCHFVMVSTRKVYGPALQFPLPESAPEAPTDNYGRNKLETEGRVASLLRAGLHDLAALQCVRFRTQPAYVFRRRPDFVAP